MLAMLMVLSACTPSLVEWESTYQSSGYDFREFTHKGFLFTPESYSGTYESIGLVEITFLPEIREVKQDNSPDIKGYNRRQFGSSTYYIEVADTERIIREMFELADDMGADALSRFEINPVSVQNNGFEIPSIKISGFAIKRTDH